MDINEFKDKSNNVINRYLELKKYVALDGLKSDISKLEKDSLSENFWNNPQIAKKTLRNISLLKNKVDLITKINSKYEDLLICVEIITSEEIENDYIDILTTFISMIDDFEIKNTLNSKDDSKDAIITIHPGAGGTESQDWAEMLYRMYQRWIDRKHFKSQVIDYQPGEEAGIKDVSIEVRGEFAYGYLKAEHGVHRLVRISPFDSNGKRHTSFASIFVCPIIEEDVEVNLNEKDIRIDTYRASGAGGQHVNKTDSAVRITHIPTNITVQCQNQRSQLKNKNTALKVLKSKIYQKTLDEKNEDLKSLTDTKKDISWGSQIRSYVFHPYNLIKDHRTEIQTSNINSVLDGNIDFFIRKYLIKKMEN